MLRQIDQEICIGCGQCFKTCSFDVFRLNTAQDKCSPCMAACPAGVDIRTCMHMLQQGRHKDAANTLVMRNPFPLLTSLLCPHFCERTCTRSKIDAAVNIPALESYMGRWILDNGIDLPGITRAGEIAVIGSGVTGLAAAFFMRMRGFNVTVYERAPGPGGKLRETIDASLLDNHLDWLRKCGIMFVLNTTVSDNSAFDFSSLRRKHTKAMIIATGTDTAHLFASTADVYGDKIVADPCTLATKTNGVFAAGTVRGSRKSISARIGDAWNAAWSVQCFVDGWDMLESRPQEKKQVFSMPVEKLFIYNKGLPDGNLPAAPRKENVNDEIYKYETMILEATRCVTCGSKAYAAYKNDCMTCFFCEISCPVSAITVDPFKEKLPRTIVFEREGV